jgi:hypothetical protein
VKGLVGPESAVARLLAIVVVAEGAVFESDGAAAVSGGADVGAKGCGHDVLSLSGTP